MNKTTFTVAEDKKSLMVERTFSVEKSKLWRAYTDKSVFEQWFAPRGWEVTSKKFDFKEGGENLYTMKCVDKSQGEWYGQTSSGKQVFSNINPEDSFSYRDYFTDDDGNVNEDMPVSDTDLVLSSSEDGTTMLKFTTRYESEKALKQVLEMGMEDGMGQTLDKLEEILASL